MSNSIIDAQEDFHSFIFDFRIKGGVGISINKNETHYEKEYREYKKRSIIKQAELNDVEEFMKQL